MSFLDRFRKHTPVPLEVLEVRDRARLIHERVGRREVSITDLFSMIGEDETPVTRRERTRLVVIDSDVQRFLPGDIPTRGEESYWVGD